MGSLLRNFGWMLGLMAITGATMANDYDLTMAVNGSGNSDSIIELYVKNGSYTLISRGDTRDENMPGIGIYEGELPETDLVVLKAAKNKVGMNGGLTSYYEVDKILAKLLKNGSPLAKLEASATVEGNRPDGFLMDLSLRNSGQKSITFQSPAAWDGGYNPMLKNSWVIFSAVRDGGDGSNNPAGKFGSDFLGRKDLVNKDDFPSDYITLQPGQVVHAKFHVWPSNYFISGKYKIGVTVSLKEVTAPEKLKGSAEFMSGVDQLFDFPRDYPSTPEEVKAFSAYLKSKEAQ